MLCCGEMLILEKSWERIRVVVSLALGLWGAGLLLAREQAMGSLFITLE